MAGPRRGNFAIINGLTRSTRSAGGSIRSAHRSWNREGHTNISARICSSQRCVHEGFSAICRAQVLDVLPKYWSRLTHLCGCVPPPPPGAALQVRVVPKGRAGDDGTNVSTAKKTSQCGYVFYFGAPLRVRGHASQIHSGKYHVRTRTGSPTCAPEATAFARRAGPPLPHNAVVSAQVR